MEPVNLHDVPLVKSIIIDEEVPELEEIPQFYSIGLKYHSDTSRFVEVVAPNVVTRPQIDDSFTDADWTTKITELSKSSSCNVESFHPSLSNVYTRCSNCDQIIVAQHIEKHQKQCRLEKPYRCKSCGEEFNKKTNFDVHSNYFHRQPEKLNNEMICPVCARTFRRKSAYDGHLNTHMICDSFLCPHCQEEFAFKATFDRHLRVEHGKSAPDLLQTVEICRQCNIILGDTKSMQKHLLLHKTINKAIKCVKRNRNKIESNDTQHRCNYCEKTFRKQFELKRHLVVHTKERSFKCDMCSKSFTQKYSLIQHQKVLHSNEPFSHKCTLCGTSFSQAGNLRRHMQLLHPPNVSAKEVFRCPHCTCVFNAVQPLQVHIKRRHPEDSCIGESTTLLNSSNNSEGANRRRLLCCSICGKAFPKSSDLVRHYRTHNGSRPYSCNRCEKRFSLRSTLKFHLSVHVKDENADNFFTCARCPKCMKQLSSLSSLQRHMKIHNRSLNCKYCSQVFRTSKTLERHEMTCLNNQAQGEHSFHELGLPEPTAISEPSPLRPYQCQLCSASFTKIRCLKDHINRHTGIKPHICPLCQKSFFSIAQLNMHMEVHSGNRQFKCPICPWTFRRKFQLKTHLKMRHKIVELLESDKEILIDTNVRPSSASALDSGTYSYEVELPKSVQNFQNSFDETEIESGFLNANVLLNECIAFENIPGRSLVETGVVNQYPVHSYNFYNPETSIGDNSFRFNEQQSSNQLMDGPSDRYIQEVQNDFPTHEVTNSFPTISSPCVFDFRCPFCFFTYNSDVAMLQHLSESLSDELHKFTLVECFLCGEYIMGGQALAEHLSVIHDFATKECETNLRPEEVTIKKVQHKCEVCERSFNKPSDLHRHMRIHTGEKPYKCETCDRSFRVKSTLYQHMNTHKSIDETNLEVCAVCNKRYGSQTALRKHLRTVHNREIQDAQETNTNHESSNSKEKNTKSSSYRQKVQDDENIRATVAELAPCSKTWKEINPSENSAFDAFGSCEPNKNVSWDGTSNLIFSLRSYVGGTNIEVALSASNVSYETSGLSYLLSPSFLNSLANKGSCMKFRASFPQLPIDHIITVDVQRLMNLFARKSEIKFTVPVNISATSTGLPVEIFYENSQVVYTNEENHVGIAQTSSTLLSQSLEMPKIQPDFVTNCTICQETFLTREQSENHFAGTDHETAQIFSISNLSRRYCEPIHGEDTSIPYHQIDKPTPSEVCKLCMAKFCSREYLLAHIRREHERDGEDTLLRENIFTRRRTME